MLREQIIKVEFYKNEDLKWLEMNFESVSQKITPSDLMNIATELLPTLCKEIIGKTADIMDIKWSDKEKFIEKFTKLLYSNIVGNSESIIVKSKLDLRNKDLTDDPWSAWPRKTL